MAFYGIVERGTLSGSTAGDTLNFFASTSVASGVSVLGLDGNDVIYLGAQGYTGSMTAQLDGTAVASGTGASLSAFLNGSATYSTSTAISAALQAGTTADIAITGIITSQRGARTVVASQFYGNQGDDVILLGGGLNTITSTTVGAGAGDDRLGTQYLINSVTSNATAINGMTGGALTANNVFLEMGGGADTVTLDFFSTATISNTTIGGGQGNDVFTLTGQAAGSGTFSTSKIVLGGGNDTLTGIFNVLEKTTVNGGGGADTIVLSTYSAATGVVIDGDYNGTLSDYDGADLISAVGNQSSGEFVNSTFYGGGGNDSINFNVSAYSAVGDNGLLFALNAGNDIVSAYWLDNSTIQMGAGTDSITIGTAIFSSVVNLGGGNDTLSYAGATAGSGGTFSGNTVYGGAGADVLSATNGIGDGETAGAVWALSSIADSTLTAANRDTITFGSTGTSVIYRARFDEFNLSLGTFRTGDQSATNGVVTFTAGTDGSVTSRAEIINGSMTTQGNIAGFSDSSNRAYLFIQGGSSYSIVQLGNGANTSVSALASAGGKDISITMGA